MTVVFQEVNLLIIGDTISRMNDSTLNTVNNACHVRFILYYYIERSV